MSRAIAIIRVGDDAEWTTEVGEDALSDREQRITGGTLKLTDQKEANHLSVSVSDPRLEIANALPLPYTSDRVPVECWFGYAPRPPRVFSGWLASIQAKGMSGTTTIEATDKARALRKKERARNIAVTSAAALVEKLADEAGLEADLSDASLGDVEFASALQAGESSADVLWRIVEQAGHVATIENETLVVRERGTEADEVERIRLGRDVRQGFSFQVDELSRSTTENVHGLAGESLYSSESLLDEDVEERLVQLEQTGLVLQNRDAPGYQDKAVERALRASKKGLDLFDATIPLAQARPGIGAAQQVLLEGFGPRFSGAWWTRTVTHDLTKSRTDLRLYTGAA